MKTFIIWPCHAQQDMIREEFETKASEGAATSRSLDHLLLAHLLRLVRQQLVNCQHLHQQLETSYEMHHIVRTYRTKVHDESCSMP